MSELPTTKLNIGDSIDITAVKPVEGERVKNIKKKFAAIVLALTIPLTGCGLNEEKVNELHNNYVMTEANFDGAEMNLDYAQMNWEDAIKNAKSAEDAIHSAVAIVEEVVNQSFDITPAIAPNATAEEQAAIEQAIIDVLTENANMTVSGNAAPDEIFNDAKRASDSRKLSEKATGFSEAFELVSTAKAIVEQKPGNDAFSLPEEPAKPIQDKYDDEDYSNSQAALASSEEVEADSERTLADSEEARNSTADKAAQVANFRASLETESGGNTIQATNGNIAYQVYYETADGKLSLDPSDGARQKVAFGADRLRDGIEDWSRSLDYLYGNGSVAALPLMFAFEPKNKPEDQYGLGGGENKVGALSFTSNGISEILKEEEYLTKAKELGLPTYDALLVWRDKVSTEKEKVYAVVEAYGLEEDDTVWLANYGDMIAASDMNATAR